MKDPARQIIHIDMDAFYAAVEQRDFPQFRGKPVVVGGSPQRRGVVAACSYEAREFGIHSAMPAYQAHRRCPHAIFLRPRFEVYRQVSRQIHEVLHAHTDIIEPLSLDEAYLDVSQYSVNFESAVSIARKIKQEIKHRIGLTASAGVSYNKFLAKIASDLDKPDGLFVISPQQGPTFVEQLSIAKFHGIGKVTERRMHGLGIRTGADLKRWSLVDLQRMFGKLGAYYFKVARGIDERPVMNVRVRKSMGAEITFDHDIKYIPTMLGHLQELARELAADLKARGLAGRTLSIKLKYDDFELITRSKTLDWPIQDLEEMLPVLPVLLSATEAGQRKVRLLGVRISNFDHNASKKWPQQLPLFPDTLP